jgi:hypothetical protein
MERGQMVMQGEDVIGIIDRYIESSGGAPVLRDETGARLGGGRVTAKA